MIYNLDAERSLLAACLIDNKGLDRAGSLINAMDFWEPKHQAMWAAMNEIVRCGDSADVVTLDDKLGARGPGISELAEMCRDAVTSADVKHLAGIIKDKSRRRAVSAAIASVMDDLNSPSKDLTMIIDGAQERLSSMLGHSDRKVTEVKEWIGEWLDTMDSRVQGVEREKGLSTGSAEIDEHFTLRAGDLHVLAGESGMGKTVAAVHLIDAVTMRQGKPSLMFQLEMSKEAIWERVAASYSGARIKFIKRPNDVPGDDWSLLATAVQRVKDSPLTIDDRPGLTMSQIRGEAKRWRDHWGHIGLLVIDYVGIVQPEDRRAPREQQIADITKSCKVLAKDLDCPVVLLAQINRDNTRRTDKRPIVTDLRESAALQHNADVISLVYREEYHNPESERRGIMEWIVAKNREGEVGTVEVVCDLSRSSLKPFTAQALDIWRRENPQVERVDHEVSEGSF